MSTCRLRKVQCPECGYTSRITRSWMTVGLPTCCCGERMRPTEPADLAYCGLIGQEDCPGPLWTAICRENGWEASIVRSGAAAKAYGRRMMAQGGELQAVTGAEHCSYAGCGRWIAGGADVCTAGHPQHADAVMEAMPF